MTLSALLQEGRNQDARRQAASALSGNPGDPEALLTLARLAAAQGDLTGAELLLQQAEARANPLEIRLTRSALSAIQGNRQAAIEGFAAVLREQPERPEALFGLATSLAEEKRYTEALPLFFQLTRLMPENGRLHYHLGRTLMELSRLDEALESLSRSLAKDPYLVEAYLVASRVLCLKKQATKAGELVRAGLQLIPGQPRLLHEAELARERYEQASRGNAAFWLAQGTAWEDLGDLERAREAYAQATRCSDASWVAVNRLGLVLLRQNQEHEAAACFHSARRQAPGRPEPLLNLARVYAREPGQHLRACRLVEKVLRQLNLPGSIREQARELARVLGRSSGWSQDPF
ncbi:MAG: tetratricopeptide repeat protein [Candidatus Eremiobacteraeota bacterium]|nr:tetratricopeptide repeat protein [Candidatus Eremiobacteraeota bacterium]